VANAYTSVTTAGLGTNTITLAYDLALKAAYRTQNCVRDTFATVRPERPSHNGNSVRLLKHAWFDSTAVNAAKTPLTEESDVDSVKAPGTTYVDVTVNEYGFVNTRTELLTLESFDAIDPYIAQAVGFHMADTFDELVLDVLDTATPILATGKASKNLITNTSADDFKASHLRDVATRFKARNVPNWGGAGIYGCLMHPHVTAVLREDGATGGWRLPNEYGASQANIWNGEIGTFEGFRIVESMKARRTTDGASSAAVYRSYFLGPEAVVEVVKQEPHFVVGPDLDKLRRFRHVGWKGTLGWALYRPESLQVVLTGSTKAAVS